MKKFTSILIISALLVSILPTTVMAAWFDSTFTYCRKMTMTAGGTSGGVATTTTLGYPLLATSTIADLKYSTQGGKVQTMDTLNSATSSPLDVIFTSGTDCNSDGGSLLDFHFEEYASTTGKFVAWIESTDMSSTTAKTVLMYYGKASATDQRDETGTWDANYKGVWHLKEYPNVVNCTTNKEICDSTSNANNGDMAGAMTSGDKVSAQIGNGQDLDGTNDYFSIADSASIDYAVSQDFTVSVWAKAPNNQTTGTNNAIIEKWDGGAGGYPYVIRFQSQTNADPNEIATRRYDGTFNPGTTSTTGNYNDNSFHYLVFSKSGATLSFYNNGTSIKTATDTTTGITTNASLLYFGSRGGVSNYFTGVIDEVRISNIVRHAMDILTDYNSQVNSALFWTIGSEETETVATPTGVGKKATIIGARIIIVGGRVILP